MEVLLEEFAILSEKSIRVNNIYIHNFYKSYVAIFEEEAC